MVASNDDLVFLDDSEDGTGDAANLQPWRVLVVDDDQMCTRPPVSGWRTC